MTSSTVSHWADVLTLRPEVTGSAGSIGELQMSLHKAVYQTVDVPYRKVDYYVDITQPTPNLVGFFARVARRLGTAADATALFHLDQGMGGGKSHALVGLYHMAASPDQFFATELGRLVKEEAELGGVPIDLTGGKAVTLTADYFSPGKASETFGPATNLFERFLWALVDGDMERFQRYAAGGPNKATLQQALLGAGRPVLILLDELMDYVLQLADATNLAYMPGEKAFLNALMDACDDVPRVAFVVVMIRSELDERGYPVQAEEFRDYVSARLVRNGTTVAVTEAQDFSAIIRRRLFEAPRSLPSTGLAQQFANAADPSWREKVFDKLGTNRGTLGLADRVAVSYPFHPELMRLVRDEWSRVQGFQRVRSTVSIFARAALYWVNEHKAGRWAPALVGVGDIPLTVALEQVLSSGLLLGNDRAIQGYRAVAGTDVTSTDASGGRAVVLEQQLLRDGITVGQPHPAIRMATALFCYSLVGRAQAKRGATKAELLASLFLPLGDSRSSFTQAEEVFNTLTGEEGLGALETTASPNAPARYYLSIKQTLRMYFTAATAVVSPEERDDLIWSVAQRLVQKGPFDEIRTVDSPTSDLPLERVFEGVDTTSNRLVVLDPRRWALLNGKDSASRADITALLGLGEHALRVDNAASCVVVAVNTQQRDVARKRAGEVLAWRYVLRQIGDEAEDERADARAKLDEAEVKLRRDIERAYRHYAYLVRAGELHVQFDRFDDDARTALKGDHIWTQLVHDGRATIPGGLGADYVATLLGAFDRALTPKEIVQGFYKNPAFPLVPSTDEVRRALFDLLRQGWEFVDADGNPLSVASPGQISINSISQTLRHRTSALADTDGATVVTAGAAGVERLSLGATGERPGLLGAADDQYRAGGPSLAPTQRGPVSYKRYRVVLTNRSITSPEARDQVWQLLKELAKVIDPAGEADHQLLSLDFTLTTAAGHQGGIEDKAKILGAQVSMQEEDF
jgi:hypothetical protein